VAGEGFVSGDENEMKYPSGILGMQVGMLLLASQGTGSADLITSKGSDTMVILAQRWAEHYMRTAPETEIQVTGGGSGTGFAALQNRATDLATASRPIKPKEKVECIKTFKKLPAEYKVALDGLSVYVNRQNPLEELLLDQLEGIFTGRITNWQEVGGLDAPITLYSRENSSGTYEFFKEHVLKNRDFAASTQTMPGTAAVVQAVAKDPNGIGYGGAAFGRGAKALRIRRDAQSPAIAPSAESIANQSYPIWRYLYIYVNPDLNNNEVTAYLDWILSEEGQAIVEDVGYFPLRVAGRPDS
jgi:phosphate transport system substrate-binding protein